jgi:hypothetical protein
MLRTSLFIVALMSLGCGASAGSERPSTVPQRIERAEQTDETPRVIPRRVAAAEAIPAPSGATTPRADRPSVAPPPVEPPAP